MTQLIEDYYRDVVRMNESGAGGWSTCYYGTVTNIINMYNYKKVVEVGIGYGLHAKELLKNSNLEHLYLVDPTKYYPGDGFATDIMKTIPRVPNNQFNELYELIRNELSPWSSKYTWYRKESLSITNSEIADGSVDCVFVDGDHTYDAVKHDLRFWWKKVRSGGMLLGDDYWMEGVARAVHEFAEENGLIVTFAPNPANESYKIYQFFKD